MTATISGQTVALSWLPPAWGDAPVSYVLEAGASSGRADLVNGDTGSPLTTLITTDVPPGRYFYRVRARNASGTSALSNEIVVTIAAACGATPSAPSNLRGLVEGAAVTLNWRAPVGGCAATSYVIEAGSGFGLSNLARFSTGSTATAFSAISVISGTYYVRVRASNDAGTSLPSNEIVVSVAACTGPPGVPDGLTVASFGSTVTLSWTASTGEPTSYIVTVGSSPSAADLATFDTRSIATSFSATDVGAGAYYVRVQARNACGTSSGSNESGLTVGPPLSTPTTVLHVFTGGSDGTEPSTLVQAADGNFYGTTSSGGTFGYGIVFRMTPAGGFATLYSFNGVFPGGLVAASNGQLVEASNGDLYGIAFRAEDDMRAAFKVTPAGVVELVHVFEPRTPGYTGRLYPGLDGSLYGTIVTGGVGGNGTVFKLSLDGTVTILHTFTGSGGRYPLALIHRSDGNFYGTTLYSGTGFGPGTIFRMTAAGVATTLFTFARYDNPLTTFVQGADGNFYGTTRSSYETRYTAFRITPGGDFTTLHVFSQPEALPEEGDTLIPATNGNLYGVARIGGTGQLHPLGGPCSQGCGTVYELTPAGVVTRLHEFTFGDRRPTSLIQATDGNLYGTNRTTLFRLTP